ncbi:MAG: hypothetical protein HGA44_03075 [Cellulomonadaceae bacterium]|nr:hypothetical protein [Cellulomonadaceae bacterium]
MDHDLSRSLRDLSTAADTGDGHLPVDQILRRVHRRRARTAATYSAVGVTAVTALVVGGALLVDRDDAPQLVPVVTPTATTPAPTPTPTATPTTTPSPTPTPPAEVVVLPTPSDWAISWDQCGRNLGEDTSAGGPLGETARVANIPTSLGVGQPLDVDVTMAWTGAQPFSFGFDGLVAIAPGGAVIGVSGNAPTDVQVTPAGSTSGSVRLSTTLVSCVGAPDIEGGRSGEPLAAGTYALGLLYTVPGEDGTPSEQIAWTASWFEVTGPGGAVQPTAATSEVATSSPRRFDAGMNQTACGETIDLGTSSITYPLDLRGTARLVDGQLVASITAINTGRNLRSTSVSYPEVVVVRDGRVIGMAAGPNDAGLAVDRWPTGGALTSEISLGAHTCTFMYGQPWPAGTYQLYAYQTGSTRAEGGPWTFTID